MLKKEKMPVKNQSTSQSNVEIAKLSIFKLEDIPYTDSKEATPRPDTKTKSSVTNAPS